MSAETEDGGAERRTSERIPARIEVRFTSSDQAARAIKSYSLNFSIGGLCLKTKKAYPVGHDLSLTMAVNGEQFMVRGVVAWIRGGTIGVRFVDVQEADRARLSAMIAALKPES